MSATYRESPAPGPLASHACCVWTNAAGPGGHLERVLPDGCADVVWIEGEGIVVAGPATREVIVALPAGTAALGVRFGPGAAGAGLGLAARDLRDRTVALEDVWGPQATELAERLSAAPPAARLGLLAAAVARRLDGARAPDALVARASALLAGGMPVTAASREVALTDRHLRRRFDVAVGYGPKTLQRVLRLRRFLALAESGPSADLARAAADAGYSDQPHLTRECADLAGLPPAALLASRAAA
jgi:AraC-like DNA-binding protein